MSDTAKLLKHCSVLKAKAGHPKRAHFSLSTVHTDSNESNKAECANLSSCFSNSGETSRHRFPDVSATTPAFSVVAKAPIPPEPPPPPFKLRALLIGAGLCTERSISVNIPIEVVCVIEINDLLTHARNSFPNAQVLENLDSVIEQLEHDKLKLVPFDLVVSTLPCTDESTKRSYSTL